MAELGNSDYIRKEVFDARMDRMEMLLEKTVTEIKAYVDKAISDLKAENAKFRDEIRAENAKFRDEIRAENAKFRDEIKVEINGMKVEIAGVKTELSSLKAEVHEVRNETRLLSARIDSLENVFYWGLGCFGIILASAVIVPAILGFLKKLFTPSVTIEDVERIVNTAIANHLASTRGGNAQ